MWLKESVEARAALNINYDLLKKIELALRGTQGIDKYAVYAICHDRSSARSEWSLEDSRSEANRILSETGMNDNERSKFAEIMNKENKTFYYFKFNEEYWRSLKSFPLDSVTRVVMSCELGVAKKSGKHLILDPVTSSPLAPEDWLDYLRSFMASVDVQIRTLLREITATGDEDKAPFATCVSRWHNGGERYDPYLNKLDEIARAVKKQEVVPNEQKSSTKELIKGWSRDRPTS